MNLSKKLIEVALPLDAINRASAREKSIRHGHPSTLHLWWARRPLAAARAVIFAQMVDDPSEYVDVLLSDAKSKRAAERELKKRQAEHAAKQDLAAADAIPEPEPTLEEVIAEIERDRLFGILEQLVLWENTTNDAVLEKARTEIWQSWRRACAKNSDDPRAKEIFVRSRLPDFHDPFAGGGTLSLEAQRLGLHSYASDLNPVAVLINKAMIEIPPEFAGKPPVNPESRAGARLFSHEWKGVEGLAEDVRHYGTWMANEAKKRIGHLYPNIEVTAQMAAERSELKAYLGRQLTVIAWIWARTVKSPNPAFSKVEVPLTSTFLLSTKKGKEVYVEPIVEEGSYAFTVHVGTPRDSIAAKRGTKLSGSAFRCLMSDVTIDSQYIRREAQAGRMRTRLMAAICEGDRERVYFSPTSEMEQLAASALPTWKPDLTVTTPCHDVDRLPMYGMPTWGDAFTSRQQLALTTFADLVADARDKALADALSVDGQDGIRDEDAKRQAAEKYADSVATYLGLGVGRSANYWSSLTPWAGDFIVQTFGRNAIRMVWDFAEANPFSGSTGNWNGAIDWIQKAMVGSFPARESGKAFQGDAQTQTLERPRVISTDPPYYDNIGYAELSDFFYVWLRRALHSVYPQLFSTLAVPKADELVAAPHRQGGKKEAESFFLEGMTQAMHQLVTNVHPAFPVTIYYAFKQAESRGASGVASTGWETFLDAVMQAGLAISGTWPIRTERDQGLKSGTNVLASSIVLVCRLRSAVSSIATRREFVVALKSELPQALIHLQRGNIAPVDLAQAAIGPGMAIYTRYKQVVDAEGRPLSVRDALVLINQTLDEVLAEQEGDFDADSRWALAWFEQHGFEEGEYGVAEVLSKAKVTSVAGLDEAGIIESRGGRVRLLKPEELPETWDPTTDPRLTAWEMVHHLIRVLEANGESAASELARELGAKSEVARELCYRLYTLCERKKRATEALSYNGLVQSWPEIMRLVREKRVAEPGQTSLFSGEEA